MISNKDTPSVNQQESNFRAVELSKPLGDVLELIKDKGPTFFKTLAMQPRNDSSFGWQKISTFSDSTTKKLACGKNDEGAIFTGEQLCNFASYALYEALVSKFPHISIDIVQLFTDFRAEDWNRPDHNFQEWDHVIVKISSGDGKEVMYLDPTYRAINHDAEQSIKIITESELSKFYQDRQRRVPSSVLYKKESVLRELEGWGLTKEYFHSLVNSLD